MRGATRTMLAAGMLLLVGGGAATAGQWCGENGVVRLGIVSGDTLASVAHVEPAGPLTTVELVATLTDVEPVVRRGEVFLRVGGCEFRLVIEGAEGTVIEQKLPENTLNLGRNPGEVAAGFAPGEKLVDGAVELVRWRVMFQGRPENVRFGLSQEGMITCKGMADCSACASPVIYVGAESTGLLDAVCGAGYAPAWLNPTETPDLAPVTGRCTWRDVGVFEAR